MRLLFENDELDNLIRKYHLMVYSGIINDYYICFDGDVPSGYIGIYITDIIKELVCLTVFI